MYNFKGGDDGYQPRVRLNDVDYVNKYFFCANGIWDWDYMSRKVLGRSVRLNWSNDTIELFQTIQKMEASQRKDVLKEYKK